MLTAIEKAIKHDRKRGWTHYSKDDPLFWRDSDGTTTACGKTARRISHTNNMDNVTCPRCIESIKQGV